jgi:hypothetical protein
MRQRNDSFTRREQDLLDRLQSAEREAGIQKERHRRVSYELRKLRSAEKEKPSMTVHTRFG